MAIQKLNGLPHMTMSSPSMDKFKGRLRKPLVKRLCGEIGMYTLSPPFNSKVVGFPGVIGFSGGSSG